MGITKFNNYKQLIAFYMLGLTIIQSAKSINVRETISKSENKYQEVYLVKKAEGKFYYKSLTACSIKILIMFIIYEIKKYLLSLFQ